MPVSVVLLNFTVHVILMMEPNKYLCITILLCLITIGSAQRTPTISHISQQQIRDIGGQVDLDCSVHYAQEFPVLWVKYDRFSVSDYSVESIPLSSNAVLIIKDSRVSLRYDDATGTFTLSNTNILFSSTGPVFECGTHDLCFYIKGYNIKIKDIQENDAGLYQCQVLISISNKITAEVELQVRRPPIISDNSTRSLVASEGESVQMECYAGGFPPPKISWRRENNAILPTGGSIHRGNILKIGSVRKEDRGTYYCVAENGVDRGARRNISLEVEFAPVITVPRPRLEQVEEPMSVPLTPTAASPGSSVPFSVLSTQSSALERDVTPPPATVVVLDDSENTVPQRSTLDSPVDVGSALKMIMEELRSLRYEVLELRKELKESKESCKNRMEGLEIRSEVLTTTD